MARSTQPTAAATGNCTGSCRLPDTGEGRHGKCASCASVAATPKSLTDSANTIANADQHAGASSANAMRPAAKRLPPCTACGRLELPAKAAQRTRHRKVGEWHAFDGQTITTPTGP
jgi:hypothetical protein